jgi:hypothetical protein
MLLLLFGSRHGGPLAVEKPGGARRLFGVYQERA